MTRPLKVPSWDLHPSDAPYPDGIAGYDMIGGPMDGMRCAVPRDPPQVRVYRTSGEGESGHLPIEYGVYQRIGTRYFWQGWVGPASPDDP